MTTHTITTHRSGPPDTAPAIVTTRDGAPMLVLLSLDDRERAIRDLAVAYQAAGARALAQAGAVLLAPFGGGQRGDAGPEIIGQWAAALGCEVVEMAARP